MKVGIIGGTFDPVHDGHLHLAREAVRSLLAEKVLFIPNHLSPFKGGQTPASAAHRLQMLRLAVRDFPEAEVLDLEIRRGGFSYTIETLRELRSLYPPPDVLYFLIGADLLKEMPGWKGSEKFKDYCRIAVAARPGFSLPDQEGVEVFTREVLPYSATEIRSELHAGKAPRGIPSAVLAYIRSHGLYV